MRGLKEEEWFRVFENEVLIMTSPPKGVEIVGG
jgi:hypothetical protein